MQDDCYAIAADGWKAQTYRVIETDKKGKRKDKGWACDLVPKPLVVARYFAKEQASLQALQGELEGVSARLAELEEEHSGDDAAFVGFDKINVAAVKDRLREIEGEVKAEIKAAKRGKSDRSRKALAATGSDAEEPVAEELRVLLDWLKLAAEESALKKSVKEADAALDAAAYAKYTELTEAEVQVLVVDDKWLAALEVAVHGEMDRLSQQLTARVKELAERYEAPLPQLSKRVAELETRVSRHLERMGFSWR